LTITERKKERKRERKKESIKNFGWERRGHSLPEEKKRKKLKFVWHF
jgi:hypothetical protein